MTKEEYTGVQQAQLALSRLSSMLDILSQATDDGVMIDAIDLCSGYAKAAYEKVDVIPGFQEAQSRRA